jgi:alanine-synthesizing transaminase
MLSSRLPAALAPNAISRAVAALRAAGVPLLDLTETNPTSAGIAYSPRLLDALANPSAIRYEPEPLGLPAARDAVAAAYTKGATPVQARQIVITASTSEAYSLLFKLLCDPGDHVLVPQPSYPLFESLTRLDDVVAAPYRMEYHGLWSIDRDRLSLALGPRTRAVLVVSPNNPTGSMLRSGDRNWLAEQCAGRGIALISDEVFADYPLRPGRDATSLLGEDRALTFTLGGLSKSAGLPQVKLGWMVVSGPPAETAAAMARLEIICDTYLSVSTPVQLAAASLIDAGVVIRDALRDRLARNLETLEQVVGADSSVSILQPEGGWSVVLRVPATQSEESLVLRLLEDARVLVHPGFFFDFADEAYLVVSLLPDPATFREAIERTIAVVHGGRVA